MYDINFLTEEYKEKLNLENFGKNCLVGFMAGAMLLYGISHFIKKNHKRVRNNITRVNQEIANAEKKTKETEIKIKEVPDFTNKISIIEDVFENKDLRFSEVFYSLKKNTPKNVWLSSLSYEDGKINIRGVAFENLELSAEKNAYEFEKRMLLSGSYTGVTLEKLTTAEKYGNKVVEFDYRMSLE